MVQEDGIFGRGWILRFVFVKLVPSLTYRGTYVPQNDISMRFYVSREKIVNNCVHKVSAQPLPSNINNGVDY